MADAFNVMEEYVKCVARKHANGLLICGPGGIGKTETVIRTLRAERLTVGEQYMHVKGYSTPLGLYNYLYENANRLVVFDDCDSVFKDLTGLNVLKSVLETTQRRVVCWNSTSAKVEIPEFVFKGQIIFISNMDPSKTTNSNFIALLTRCFNLVISATPEEILFRMAQILPEVASTRSILEQNEILIFLKDNYKNYQNLSLRLLVNIVSLRRYSPTNWRTLALNLT